MTHVIWLLKSDSTFKLCSPRNILLWISNSLFSESSSSVIRKAPSKAFSSIPVIWFRRRSNFIKFGSRPKSPSDLIRPNSLSWSSNSVVYNGMSRGISLSPFPEQSTIVPSHVQPVGQALSIKHSPAYLVRNSS